jgi:hypothetical protein
LDGEIAPRRLAQPTGDGPSVELALGEGLEQQQVERSLEQLAGSQGGQRGTPLAPKGADGGRLKEALL